MPIPADGGGLPQQGRPLWPAGSSCTAAAPAAASGTAEQRSACSPVPTALHCSEISAKLPVSLVKDLTSLWFAPKKRKFHTNRQTSQTHYGLQPSQAGRPPPPQCLLPKAFLVPAATSSVHGIRGSPQLQKTSKIT